MRESQRCPNHFLCGGGDPFQGEGNFLLHKTQTHGHQRGRGNQFLIFEGGPIGYLEITDLENTEYGIGYFLKVNYLHGFYG